MTIATHSAPLSDLAAILAKGYLRLTETAPDSAISGHKELALPAEESPDRVDDNGDHECRQRPA